MIAFRVEDFRFHVLPMRTRFPFRYGIASLDWLPHLVVSVDVIVDGERSRGVTSEGLPPKWFTKGLRTTFEEDLAEMIAAIQNAARIGRLAGRAEGHFGDWWRSVQDEQTAWAGVRGVEPLLAGLGVSMVERAVLDGLCRAMKRPLHELMRAGMIIPDLGVVRNPLSGVSVAEVLAANPKEAVIARHTVGLGDWIREEEVQSSGWVDDGLPASLEACITTYGLTHFKIKLCGDLESDKERLGRVFETLVEKAGPNWKCTLDGNEAFLRMEAFREFYEVLSDDPRLKESLGRVLFVEQPLRRDVCLDEEVSRTLSTWNKAPAVLLDEGDGDLGAWMKALELGYRGVSHKNCKGILKGMANLAVVQQANGLDGGQRFVSGEDLANVGPVALNQDLAVQAMLGVGHVERNGHHYFRGLSMWAPEVQGIVMETHGDLYSRHEAGFPTLKIRGGMMGLASVNAAPFGCALGLDWVEKLEPLNDWIRRGGLSD